MIAPPVPKVIILMPLSSLAILAQSAVRNAANSPLLSAQVARMGINLLLKAA